MGFVIPGGYPMGALHLSVDVDLYLDEIPFRGIPPV
jgi:hypothetical protein